MVVLLQPPEYEIPTHQWKGTRAQFTLLTHRSVAAFTSPFASSCVQIVNVVACLLLLLLLPLQFPVCTRARLPLNFSPELWYVTVVLLLAARLFRIMLCACHACALVCMRTFVFVCAFALRLRLYACVYNCCTLRAATRWSHNTSLAISLALFRTTCAFTNMVDLVGLSL